ncbi:MAG TPA: glycosyltransferase family 4 protein [Aliidongia sp.]|uniref:glycosyltransferase family 4 protein n=1 Tax=Aliidongia sp. TaxID=1914230 RepID=UPI002DDCBD94|nr:glycosyltransferase family 4 protein [Aliidongia sp.]HEV2677728.1 glycosyltransferase family 4 protein [Aliidongia sp.]
MDGSFTFIVPGDIEQITGGYLYDRRVIEGLRAEGRRLGLLELLGRFPDADWTAQASAAACLAALPDGAAVCIDGLALAAFEAVLPAHADRLAIIVLVHHALALETGLSVEDAARYATLERKLLPLCQGVLCPSARSAADVAAYGVPRDRIAVIPPGTDRPDGSADLPPSDRPGMVRLLTVATVTPRKGHRLLVEALADIDRSDWHLTAIGSLERDPATVADLRALIADRGLEDRVDLAGEWPPERLSEAYRAADLFVLPSFYEGYGMAYAEAMAHGLPILGTDAGAIPLTVPATAGILVPAGDRGALAAALAQMIGDGVLRARYAAGARAAADGFVDWAETARRWGGAFDLLAKRG